MFSAVNQIEHFTHFNIPGISANFDAVAAQVAPCVISIKNDESNPK